MVIRRLAWLALIAILWRPAPASAADQTVGAAVGAGVGAEIDRPAEDVLDLTNALTAPCESPSISLNNGGAYRFLIEVGATTRSGERPQTPWRVVIQSGANEALAEVEGRGERFKIVLTDKNTFAGERLLTPEVNLTHDSFCVEIERGPGFAEPPQLLSRAKIAFVRSGTSSALSAIGDDPTARPNWIRAAELLADCTEENGCEKSYAPKDAPVGAEGGAADAVRMWTARARAAPEDGGLTPAQKRGRIEGAVAPIVWLLIEKHAWSQAEGAFQPCPPQSLACMFHCTAFFVAPRVLLTNSHCLVGHDDVKNWNDPIVWNLRFQTRGWIRPVSGGEFELRRAPDLQALTPIFVGSPVRADYALLYVEDENEAELKRLDLSLPAPLTLKDVASADAEIAILGYPLENELMASFDKDCVIIKSGDYVQHKCDTEGGNSGSPVFDRDLEHVTALHAAGYSKRNEKFFCPDGAGKNSDVWKNCVNFAIPLSRIRDDIASKMGGANLWRFVGDECALKAGIRRGDPLSTLNFEMPVLEGGRGPSPRQIVDAYNSLPDVLKSPQRHACSAAEG